MFNYEGGPGSRLGCVILAGRRLILLFTPTTSPITTGKGCRQLVTGHCVASFSVGTSGL
jgi:hypothetical protein